MRTRWWVVVLTVGLLTVGCAACIATSVGASAGAPAKDSIVGRWQTLRKCKGLVDALKQAHLRVLAPSVLGDYFPNTSPERLARKRHICRGAEAQRHSHFFTYNKLFGSFDQDHQVVDDGKFQALDANRIRIGNRDVHSKFRYRIKNRAGHSYLSLRPIINDRRRRKALAHPFEFSAAGWSVAVAYTGHLWKSVPCKFCERAN
jgi:hypothetical protein